MTVESTFTDPVVVMVVNEVPNPAVTLVTVPVIEMGA